LTDAYHDPIASQNITLSLYSDSSCTTLSPVSKTGHLNATNLNGQAVFTAFQATVAGTYYVKASGEAGVYSSCSGSSGALTILPGPVSMVTFSRLAAGTVVTGSYFTTQPIVMVTDSFKNGIGAASVTLSAFADSACTTLLSVTLHNNVVSTNSLGEAAFSSLYSDDAGTIYFLATSSNLFNLSTFF
jgi:hypothetical protein